MSEGPEPRVGITTAAETAWFEQEAQAEVVGFERPTATRRVTLLIGAGFALVGLVVTVALLVASPRRAGRAAEPVTLGVAAPALLSDGPAPAPAPSPAPTPTPASQPTTATPAVAVDNPAAAAQPTATERLATKAATKRTTGAKATGTKLTGVKATGTKATATKPTGTKAATKRATATKATATKAATKRAAGTKATATKAAGTKAATRPPRQASGTAAPKSQPAVRKPPRRGGHFGSR